MELGTCQRRPSSKVYEKEKSEPDTSARGGKKVGETKTAKGEDTHVSKWAALRVRQVRRRGVQGELLKRLTGVFARHGAGGVTRESLEAAARKRNLTAPTNCVCVHPWAGAENIPWETTERHRSSSEKQKDGPRLF